MATTYKVLGQVAATAAATSAVANLVPDPLLNITSLTSNNNTANALTQLNSTGYTTAWRAMPESNTNIYYDGVSVYGSGANKSWQGTNSLAGYNNSGSTAQIGFTTSAATTNTGLSFNGGGNLHAAGLTANGVMPVSASTTYYFGGYVNPGTSTTSDGTYSVKWYTSDGTYISASSTSTGTLTANTWYKVSSSAASPSTAAYATVNIWANIPNNRYFSIDGIWFSTLSSSSSTFPTPTTTALGNTTLTAPFNTRLTNVWSGTENLSTTVSTYAGALVDLYTVPSSTQTVVSTITATNLTTSATSCRVSVVLSGETAAAKNFIVFDGTLAANGTEAYTLGITLNAGDKIKIASDSANVVFSAFGSEIA